MVSLSIFCTDWILKMIIVHWFNYFLIFFFGKTPKRLTQILQNNCITGVGRRVAWNQGSCFSKIFQGLIQFNYNIFCLYRHILPETCLVIYGISPCGGLSLTGCQVPTKAVLSSIGLRRENTRKGSWAEIKPGRHHSPVSITSVQNRLNLAK